MCFMAIGFMPEINLCYAMLCYANGTRHGGVWSLHLFTHYVRPDTSFDTGCDIGGLFVNFLAYADDMVLIAPSWYAMQSLIKLLETWRSELDIMCYTTKTVCMILQEALLMQRNCASTRSVDIV